MYTFLQKTICVAPIFFLKFKRGALNGRLKKESA